MKSALLLFFTFYLSVGVAFAQSGDELLEKDDYRNAIRAYQIEVRNNPSAYFNMAKAYFALQEFDNAIQALENYKKNDPKADNSTADKWLELLRREDQPVKIENLGERFNTPESELVPRVTADGKTLFFLSDDREGGLGGEDIWYCSRNDDGTWSDPKNFTAMNTSSNEGILAISPDGGVAILFGHYTGSFGGGDLFYSVKTENGWSYPCNLGGTINTKKWESLASLSPDGKTLIYSTTGRDGEGNSDLWVTQLTETGWTTPKNLGKTINTQKNEKWPFIAADGKTVYFSSNGHFGFGGSDLFMVKRLDDTWTNWSEPVNMGRYINTLNDDADFSVTGSGIKGFITRTNMPDGYGSSDIYQFYLPLQFRPEQVYNVYGRVNDENDSNAHVNIRYYEFGTDNEVAKTSTDAADGMYTVALQKGKKYDVVIDMKGYLYFSTVLDLSDPDLLRKKEPFHLKLKSKQEEVDRIQSELDAENAKLKEALNSGSENIQEAFDRVETILRRYKKAIADLEHAMAEAKFQWMEEEGQSLNIRQDYTLQTAKVGAKFELKNIFFDFGKTTLRKDSEAELDKLYAIMSKSEIVIELGGHTDSIGSEEANQRLSQDRVNSVRNYLVNKGIDPGRLKAVGYGETQPVASNSSEEGRALNRRVEVKILSLKMEREGGEEVVEENDKKKKKKKEEDAPVAMEKGNMLELLQKAAKNGGLPSGSDCNKEVQYNPNYKGGGKYQPAPKKNTNKGWFSKWGGNGDWNNFGTVQKKDFVLRTFNASVLNWKYKPLGGSSLGVEVSFLSKSLIENRFQFYFANPTGIKAGIGYNRLRNAQVGSTPLFFCLGMETKLMYGKPEGSTFTDDKLFGHLGIPVGFRYLIRPSDKIMIGPELMYTINVWTSRTKRNDGVFENGANYLSLGANARWRFIHAGLGYNMGPTVNFLGFRAGVSF